MSDLSKIAGKFDLQKIIGEVKSVLGSGSVTIPDANKDDPLGYCLSELGKLAKDLADSYSKQADTVSKISSMLGTLHQEVTNIHNKEATKETK